jgi:hypothetical protein
MDSKFNDEATALENDPERLNVLLRNYSIENRNATFRKGRCEMLMRRKHAKKWNAEKTAKMVRRYVAASSVVEKTSSAMAYINDCLNRLHERSE